MSNEVSSSQLCDACRSSSTYSFCSHYCTCLRLSCMPQVYPHGSSDEVLRLKLGSPNNEIPTSKQLLKNQKNSPNACPLTLDFSLNTTTSSNSPTLASNSTVVSITSSSAAEREARVLRYKEKKMKRQFKKRIRYTSRKAHAEMRPRVRGRFAKKGSDSTKPNTLPQTSCDQFNTPWFYL